MNRRVISAGIIATVVYFPLAYYFKIHHVEDVPYRNDVAVIPRLLKTGTPGVFYAHLWLPTYVTKATVYEDGIPIEANTVYDDASRPDTRDGRRWKLIEFNTKGQPARRWVVFR